MNPFIGPGHPDQYRANDTKEIKISEKGIPSFTKSHHNLISFDKPSVSGPFRPQECEEETTGVLSAELLAVRRISGINKLDVRSGEVDVFQKLPLTV